VLPFVSRHSTSRAKWSVLLLLAVAALVAVVAFVLQPDPSVDWVSFQSRLHETLKRNDFTIVEERTISSEAIPLPLSVQLHPRCWLSQNKHPGVIVEIGFPDGAEDYAVIRGGSSVLHILVRYVRGRASVIHIRPTVPKSAAKTLRFTLEQQFPGLPIKVTAQ
jgi:hypothetical protein